MGISRTPALWLAGSLALGIWVGRDFRPAAADSLAVVLLTLLAMACALRAGRSLAPYAYLTLAGMAFFAFGIFRMAQDLPENQPDHYAHASPGEHLLEIRLSEKLRPTAFSNRWTGWVNRVDGHPSGGTILLTLPDTLATTAWEPDDRIWVFGAIREPTTPANPHQFDYAAYLNNLGIYGSMRLQAGRFRHRSCPAESLYGKIGRLRLKLLQALGRTGFEPAETGLLQALLLGYRTSLDPGQYESYQRAGAAHLLAVSGLHVGVFSSLAGWLLWPLRRLRRGRAVHAALVLLALWSYTGLAGAGPAVVRAAVLFSLLTYALLSNRPGQSLHFWALAILFLLGVAEPLWLFQAGFQLSFAAVWAILTFYPPLYRLWPFQNGPGARLGQLCCLGTAAQIGILPLSLYFFHQFPLHFLLANVLLGPLLGVVIGWGFVLLLTAALGSIPFWMAGPYEAVLRAMNALTGWLGRQDNLIVTHISWGRVELCLGLAAVVALAGWVRNPSRVWLRGTLACMVSLQAYTIWQDISHGRRAEWVVPHRVAAGGFWFREGPVLKAFSTEPEAFASLADAYQTGERIREVWHYPLQNAYRLGQAQLLVVDADGVYDTADLCPDLVLLTGSPRIHLGRLIERSRPARIVADGTNYTSFVRRWDATCRAYGVPFHATANGAFRQEFSPGD